MYPMHKPFAATFVRQGTPRPTRVAHIQLPQQGAGLLAIWLLHLRRLLLEAVADRSIKLWQSGGQTLTQADAAVTIINTTHCRNGFVQVIRHVSKSDALSVQTFPMIVVRAPMAGSISEKAETILSGITRNALGQRIKGEMEAEKNLRFRFFNRQQKIRRIVLRAAFLIFAEL